MRPVLISEVDMTIFTVAERPTFTAPVEFSIPGNADDGAPEIHKVVIEFTRLKRSELLAFVQKETQNIVDDVKPLVVGWRNILDDQGQPVPFTFENRDRLFEITQVPNAVLSAFLSHCREAVRKN
ncbi:phage tail assembly chaperone [Pararobbsia silviterrae]|uniref:phage tail assembly chaperone n=1 Tax=Pararobbsia silviterrae TaxID=1792498 RepID=UPI001314007B|nr:phage tail assembly chaperone [Pararobbsia silviterrae]